MSDLDEDEMDAVYDVLLDHPEFVRSMAEGHEDALEELADAVGAETGHDVDELREVLNEEVADLDATGRVRDIVDLLQDKGMPSGHTINVRAVDMRDRREVGVFFRIFWYLDEDGEVIHPHSDREHARKVGHENQVVIASQESPVVLNEDIFRKQVESCLTQYAEYDGFPWGTEGKEND
jgi:hypothetical protein